eukprot:TRINITY_DN14578_c0_g1_i2.p1 TRINITY_DN14578_c0_g1~~TRINITY_DN14578_c0_g1_i2.p1  ORF type:complete len:1499 (+),score=434.39 TRINITY_DN14578_c0_g1_i2:423-4499(+)
MEDLTAPPSDAAGVQAGQRRDSLAPQLVVAATFEMRPLAESLQFWDDGGFLPGGFRLAEYGSVPHGLLDASSVLRRQQHSGLLCVLFRWEDWLREEWRPEKLEAACADLAAAAEAWAAAGRRDDNAAPPVLLLAECRPSPKVLQNGDEAQLWRRLHSSLVQRLEGVHRVLARPWEALEQELPELALKGESLYVESTDRFGHLPYSSEYFAALAASLARASWPGRSGLKVFVVDCDQSIWGGVCSEEQTQKLNMSGVFHDLQSRLAALSQAGRLVCLCSRNQEQDVLGVFEERQEDMPLKVDMLAAWRVNFGDKAENLRELAKELNLALDSFVFLDDDVIEVGRVQAALPEVLCVHLAPGNVAPLHHWALDVSSPVDAGRGSGQTAEDSRRTAMYQAEKERQQATTGMTLEAFLEALDLQLDLHEAGDEEVPRVAQLSQRTNQFNSSGLRRTEEDVRAFRGADAAGVLCGRMADRYGDYGLIAAAFWQVQEQQTGSWSLDVDSFLLSCRGFRREVEFRMLEKLVQLAQARGCWTLRILFRPSDRNARVKRLLEGLVPDSVQEGCWFCYSTERLLKDGIAAFNLDGDGEDAAAERPLSLPDAESLAGGAKRADLAAASRWFAEGSAGLLAAEGRTPAQAQPEAWQHASVKQLAERLLGLELQEEDLSRSLLELGLTSMSALQFFSSLQERFSGLTLSTTILFDYPTLDLLAARIEELVAAGASSKQSSDEGWQQHCSAVRSAAEKVLRISIQDDSRPLLELGLDALKETELRATLADEVTGLEGCEPHADAELGLLSLRGLAQWVQSALHSEAPPDAPAAAKGGKATAEAAQTTKLIKLAQSGDLAKLQALTKDMNVQVSTLADKHGLGLLHWAAGQGHEEVVQWLLSCKADPGAESKETSLEGRTPLMWACRNDHLSVAKSLVAAGADPNFVTKKGINALHWAAWGGSVAVSTWLIEDLAMDPDVASNIGCNTAVWAVGAGNIPLCDMLFAKNANFDRVNTSGHGVVNKAAWRGDMEMLRWLKEHVPHAVEAQRLTPDWEGKTPADRAEQRGHSRMARLLRYPQAAAILFDCDGVIVETEELHRLGYNEAFHALGLEVDGVPVDWSVEYYDMLQNTVGGGKPKMKWHFTKTEEGRWPVPTLLEAARAARSDDAAARTGDAAALFDARLSSTAAPEDEDVRATLVDALQYRKTEAFKRLVAEAAKPRPGVLRLMDEALAREDVFIGICSASSRAGFEKVVDSVVGKERLDRMDVIIAGDDVQRKKPDPQIYNLARARLGLDAQRCVVIEDSTIGLRAAKGANMHCVITYTASTAAENFYGLGASAKMPDLVENGDVTLDALLESLEAGDERFLPKIADAE